eukprot:gene2083-2222_t
MSDFNLSKASAPRGAFILFEGVDRCGKTTQSQLLAKYLNEQLGEGNCHHMRFPDRTTTIGTIINSYLTSKTELNDYSIHLLFSANRWERKQFIESALSQGQAVVCDRYAYSGVAFTSAKGLDLTWCQTCDQGLPSPDAIIYLDILPEEAAQRGQFGEERYERLDFQQKVREQFMKLKANDEDNQQVPWYVINAKQPIEVIHEEIKQVTKTVYEKISSKDIEPLWTKISK